MRAMPSGSTRQHFKTEIFTFILLTGVLIPALAVTIVGSYGLAVWIYQTMTGPPGPPLQ